jgi:DNA-binding NarL/FixJ family response regulator
LHQRESSDFPAILPTQAARSNFAVAHGVIWANNRGVDDSCTRVVLADDDVLLREGLASLLDRSGLEVVGQVGDAEELIEVIRQQQPELAVVDIRMPPKHATEGLDAARVIQQEFPETLRRVVRGGSAVDPALVQELVAARRTDDPLDVLTAREREVLALMAEGRSNAGIGQALWVTEGTVEKHVRSIMMKLNLPETAEAHRRVLARRGGLRRPDGGQLR